MNCFGKYTESTESLIRHEEDENVAVIREDMREVLIEDEIVEIKDEDPTGEDEVGEEMEEEVKLLTDEELQCIARGQKLHSENGSICGFFPSRLEGMEEI